MHDPQVLQIIDTAIRREEEAHTFYQSLAARVTDTGVRETVLWIAGEEQKHRDFLVRYREDNRGATALTLKPVTAYKIAEYLEEPDTDGDLSDAAVYLAASHRELRSHQFYTALAHEHATGEIKDVLLAMANEELRHKEKMEYLYANTAFPQTSGG